MVVVSDRQILFITSIKTPLYLFIDRTAIHFLKENLVLSSYPLRLSNKDKKFKEGEKKKATFF